MFSENNIVITIQYQVGIFGFLNLGTGTYSGNTELKDQQLSLKWISENIVRTLNIILVFGENARILPTLSVLHI